VRHLYLAATGMNRGKTTVCLGLLDGFMSRGLRTSFMKPVGQRTIVEDGVPADEDAVLMRTVFGLEDPLSVMSPVHIPRGFTKAYIAGEVVEDLSARIRGAHASLMDRDVVLIEGTGHAGVGAVIDLSNAAVASMLDAPAVIVSEGGVGRPIDEIVLNAALFQRHGVHVAGAIVNKVDFDAQPDITRVLAHGLGRHGIPLLGVLPYRPILSNPTLGMVAEGLGGEVICPGPDQDTVIDGVAIGAMQPEHMLHWVGPGTLVIVPGDREDAVRAIIAARASPQPVGLGLVLTGGYRPSPALIDEIRAADLFSTLVAADTYHVASAVHDLLVKTHASDHEKIALIKRVVAEHIDVDRILAVAAEAEPPSVAAGP
jgi:uncharacterized protein